jgi:hypothetical protein
VTVGLPGTGLSWTETLPRGRSKGSGGLLAFVVRAISASASSSSIRVSGWPLFFAPFISARFSLAFAMTLIENGRVLLAGGLRGLLVLGRRGVLWREDIVSRYLLSPGQERQRRVVRIKEKSVAGRRRRDGRQKFRQPSLGGIFTSRCYVGWPRGVGTIRVASARLTAA